MIDPATTTKMTVQFNLFGGTVFRLGTEVSSKCSKCSLTFALVSLAENDYQIRIDFDLDPILSVTIICLMGSILLLILVALD